MITETWAIKYDEDRELILVEPARKKNPGRLAFRNYTTVPCLVLFDDATVLGVNAIQVNKGKSPHFPYPSRRTKCCLYRPAAKGDGGPPICIPLGD